MFDAGIRMRPSARDALVFVDGRTLRYLKGCHCERGTSAATARRAQPLMQVLHHSIRSVKFAVAALRSQ